MDIKVRDSNGAPLSEGDSVPLIKDLKLKGSSTAEDYHHAGSSKCAPSECRGGPRKAATLDAVRRLGGHHTHPYVSGSDMKNVVSAADTGLATVESPEELA